MASSQLENDHGVKVDCITYDTFQPGVVMGKVRDRVDHEILQRCGDIYGLPTFSNSVLPGPELATIYSMRAYLKVVAPRPPGNIHAQERISIHNFLKLDDEIETEVLCVSKEMRGESRRIVLATNTKGSDGRALFSSEMTLLWAR